MALLDSNRTTYFAGLFLVSVLAAATRLYKLDEPPHIAWDETHFGKFASYYINRTFFLDVHPPLGKMAIALAGYQSGYDGTFAFDKPSDPYGNTSYYGMRLFCAACGTLCIPLAYLTVGEMSGSTGASFLTAVWMIFDTGLLTISQYILLDPVLLVFIMFAVLCMAKTQSYHLQHRSFTVGWWCWLSLTGLSLGCAISVKWVGLFIVLLVGLSTVSELWDVLLDVKNGARVLLGHFAARCVCLISIPISVYILFFLIHFQVLKNSGNGDAFFSSAFQATLDGNSISNCTVPPEIAYGSVITLRNARIAGGLLHSHAHLYPDGIGARQQQITVYHHRDENNKWVVRKAHSHTQDTDGSAPEFVSHGDFIRLEHASTRRLLHSHHHKAPLSTKHYQVTGYGFNGTGDMNDVWQVQVGSSGNGSPFVSPDVGRHIKVLKSRIILVHNISQCALHSSSKQLPKWGWEQKEVSCNPKLRNNIANMWLVEGHENKHLPNATLETLRPGLLDKMYESHVVMAQTNSGFKPKANEVTSRPWMWPINYQGQVFSGGANNTIRVYLLGNPIIWWSNTVCIVVYVVLAIVYSVVLQRGVKLDQDFADDCRRSLRCCTWMLIGWLLHYIPFYMMGRVLYFHHYFPAFLFNAMLTGTVLDFILRHSSRLLASNSIAQLSCTVLCTCLHAGVLSAVVASFTLFHPLSYGMTGERSQHSDSQMHGLHWLPSWEF
eukprot:scpid40617/ scgid8375/ Protein O-mannosyl-transferase 2; Dolichyl-phosphate-mannose--protein mannosyltransferase 2